MKSGTQEEHQKKELEFKVERLETNSGDVISREEMKEMDEETCDCDGNTERRRKRRKRRKRKEKRLEDLMKVD